MAQIELSQEEALTLYNLLYLVHDSARMLRDSADGAKLRDHALLADGLSRAVKETQGKIKQKMMRAGISLPESEGEVESGVSSGESTAGTTGDTIQPHTAWIDSRLACDKFQAWNASGELVSDPRGATIEFTAEQLLYVLHVLQRQMIGLGHELHSASLHARTRLEPSDYGACGLSVTFVTGAGAKIRKPNDEQGANGSNGDDR